MLPGGVEQYLSDRERAAARPGAGRPQRGESAAARERRTGKEMSRIESQLAKLDERIAALHEAMAEAAADHVRAAELNAELLGSVGPQELLEESWLAAAED